MLTPHNHTSAPVEPQSADSDPQSVLPPLHHPLHPPTPPHPYRVYGYKLNREWFAKFAKDHNIGKPHSTAGSIESSVLGYLTLRLPGFQIHFVDDPPDTNFGYSICISLATNWNRKKLERAASRWRQYPPFPAKSRLVVSSVVEEMQYSRWSTAIGWPSGPDGLS
ncbi:hypothetical protein V8E55_004046 [Tylopilus felleus]